MCAINPTHKKRFIIDVYTSDKTMTKGEFLAIAMDNLLEMELELNKGMLRYHLKETEQYAD